MVRHFLTIATLAVLLFACGTQEPEAMDVQNTVAYTFDAGDEDMVGFSVPDEGQGYMTIYADGSYDLEGITLNQGIAQLYARAQDQATTIAVAEVAIALYKESVAMLTESVGQLQMELEACRAGGAGSDAAIHLSRKALVREVH